MSAPETHLDPCGVPFTAANAEAAAALEDAIVGLVSHSADTSQHLERALAFDPELLLAHVVRGFRRSRNPPVSAPLRAPLCRCERSRR